MMMEGMNESIDRNNSNTGKVLSCSVVKFCYMQERRWDMIIPITEAVLWIISSRPIGSREHKVWYSLPN